MATVGPPVASGRSAAPHEAVRLCETPKVSYATSFPVLLPWVNPRCLVNVDSGNKQIVLFDLTADEGAASFTVAKTEQSALTAALSADSDSLCIGGSRRGL